MYPVCFDFRAFALAIPSEVLFPQLFPWLALRLWDPSINPFESPSFQGVSLILITLLNPHYRFNSQRSGGSFSPLSLHHRQQHLGTWQVPDTQLLTGQLKLHPSFCSLISFPQAVSAAKLTSPQESGEAPGCAPSHSQAMQTAHLAFWIRNTAQLHRESRTQWGHLWTPSVPGQGSVSRSHEGRRTWRTRSLGAIKTEGLWVVGGGSSLRKKGDLGGVWFGKRHLNEK